MNDTRADAPKCPRVELDRVRGGFAFRSRAALKGPFSLHSTGVYARAAVRGGSRSPLKTHLVELLRRERHAMADFILALARFDQEKRWRELEYTSLFAFLRSGLGLSAGAAQYRKTAAELVQRYPQVEDALREGKLCLSSVIELAKVLTPENVSEVLPRFFGLSSRDAAAVAVSIRPVEHPPERDVVTILRPVALGVHAASEVRARRNRRHG